jgi:hypothetical protein
MIVDFLQVVKFVALELNPDWKPSYFIIDYAHQEVVALKAVFLSIPIIFCIFYIQR